MRPNRYQDLAYESETVQHKRMCDGCSSEAEVTASHPRRAEGAAVDPIALEPVDEVVVTTLVDNSYDALMGDSGPARRARFAQVPGCPLRSSRKAKLIPG